MSLQGTHSVFSSCPPRCYYLARFIWILILANFITTQNPLLRQRHLRSHVLWSQSHANFGFMLTTDFRRKEESSCKLQIQFLSEILSLKWWLSSDYRMLSSPFSWLWSSFLWTILSRPPFLSIWHVAETLITPTFCSVLEKQAILRCSWVLTPWCRHFCWAWQIL